MTEITPEWAEQRQKFLADKKVKQTKRESEFWAFIEKGYGRGNIYKSRGK